MNKISRKYSLTEMNNCVLSKRLKLILETKMFAYRLHSACSLCDEDITIMIWRYYILAHDLFSSQCLSVY